MQKKYEDTVKKIKQKGHERITLMIIPHGEANMLSLQLSKFTIFFGLLILIGIMGASILSSELQDNIQPEVTELHDKSKTFYYKQEQYISKLENIEEYHIKLKQKLYELFEMAGMLTDGESENDLKKRLMALAEEEMKSESASFRTKMKYLVSQKQNPDVKNNEYYTFIDEFEQLTDTTEFTYNDMVVHYRKTHLELMKTMKLISVLLDFIEEREDVQKNLPYHWPLAGGHFTSFYGPRFSPFGSNSEFHSGVDLADATGTPVYASGSGKVVRANYSNGYGKVVAIKHRFGFNTIYAHMSTMLVSSGQYVRKGQMIGRVGETGRATGPHLHYEIKVNGKHIDPLPYLTTQ